MTQAIEELRIIQRVIMPLERDIDVLRLYLGGSAVFGRKAADAGTATDQVLAEKTQHAPQLGDTYRPVSSTDSAEIVGRRSVVIPSGVRVSFCSYFNAFPASYWRRWSVIDSVTLRVRVAGEATLLIYRSTGKGHIERIQALNVDSDTPVTEEVVLPLTPFVDGGWYWFDLVADGRTAVLEEAEWCAAAGDRGQGTATIGITTFNRPKFCVQQLLTLGASGSGVLDSVDEVIVVDQGTQRVVDHPEFAEAAEGMRGRLRVIDQANLGGSGGFARAMKEALHADRSDYVMLLDDDVILEPEGIARAIAFADLARTPTIVGGHMLDLYNRSVLHVFGETVERYRWWMTPAPHTHFGHDLAQHPLKHTHWLHRRAEVDYNAWWMCLIPVEIIRKIGLSLPFFIKWDDIEYGLRARKAGFPTVSLPGAAVWHVPWHSKDVMTDWQAYFTERNRIITALMYSPYERGGNMLKESLFITIKHALAMQYSTAELMLLAIEDSLKGPGDLHPSIITKLGELRELRAGFIDARAEADLEAFPPVRRRKPPRRGRGVEAPRDRRAMVRTALLGAARQLRPVGAFPRTHPQVTVPHVDQSWWLLTKFDSALVSSADGTSLAWYQRDPKRFWSLVQRATALHGRLMREWPRLSAQYRAAIPSLASPEEWQDTFDAAQRGRR
ncbi:MAG: galactofuranosylgalactofuranosylrhamnosyl-N-acetylglucosaminyl-diphospho-decaprenol [Streptosporangiaceae bacterium]|nr:galactofuranosylgalactofuranosylrhamnosyl-N-acetylglucosaminyl-diphospho-decaprenol [Streptosporangiaceae bacterium]